MKRILSLLLALALSSPSLAADKPLVMQGGQIKALPAGADLQLQNAIILPHITAPASPTDGECWTASTGLYCRISGATVGPYATGTGSVTSVQASGGTTGLSFSGGPITVSGSLTLSGTLSVANGGTGSTSATSARSALGLGIGSDVQAYSSKLASYAGGDAPSAFTLGIVDSVDAAAWRAAIGAGTSSTTGTVSSVQASGGTTGLSFSGGPITGSGTLTLGGTLAVANGGTGVTTATGTSSVVRATQPQFTSAIGVGVPAAASGSGLSFPAVQSDSTDANTLDDYEEGTWTPTITAGAGTFTTVSATGYYTKTGRQVTATVNISITTNGTAATSVKFSLPFTAGSGPFGWIGAGRENALTGNMLQALVTASGTVATVYAYNNAYPGGTGAQIIATVTYFV